MSVHERFASAARRIATATSVTRTRSEDRVRAERNGGPNGSLDSRVAENAERLERDAERLEKQFA